MSTPTHLSRFAPEDGAGLATTTQTYSGVLPRRNSMQVYTSAINAAVIRYSVYVPEVVDRVDASYRTNPKKFSVYGMSFGGSGVLMAIGFRSC